MLLFSINQVNATVFKGATSFDQEYSLVIKHMDAGKLQKTTIPIKADGTFQGEVEIKKECIVSWQFVKNDGGRQMPSAFYFHVKGNEQIGFVFYFKTMFCGFCNEVACLESKLLRDSMVKYYQNRV